VAIMVFKIRSTLLGACLLRAVPVFTNQDDKFWAYVRFLSERIGYSKSGTAIDYSAAEAKRVLSSADMSLDEFESGWFSSGY